MKDTTESSASGPTPITDGLATWLDGYCAGLEERLGGSDKQSRVMRSLIREVCEGQLVSVAVCGMTASGAAWVCWDPGENWIHLLGAVRVLAREIHDGSSEAE